MKTLFINGSPNANGNTAAMTKVLLEGVNYETLNLIDYKIYPLGQKFEDDQYEEVLKQMQQADVLVMGSPVYWHSMTGQFRQLLDRLYGKGMKSLSGKKLYFIFQGAGPSQKMLDAADYTMGIFCQLGGLIYMGMATSRKEASILGNKNLKR